MWNIFLMPQVNTANAPQIGRATIVVAWPLSGIVKMDVSTSPCQHTSLMPHVGLDMSPRNIHIAPHTNTFQCNVEPKAHDNVLPPLTPHHHSPQRRQDLFNWSRDPSFIVLCPRPHCPTSSQWNCSSSITTHAKNMKKAQRLVDYLHTYPNACIRYWASDMALHVDTDAAHLIAPKAQSCVAGHFHLSNHPNITKHPKHNGAILVECKILCHVVSSAAKAEVAGIATMLDLSCLSDTFLQPLIIPNHPPPSKLTIPQHQVLSVMMSIKNNPKCGTCVIVGSAIDKLNNNLTFFGTKAPTTMPIISLSITLQLTIKQSIHNAFRTSSITCLHAHNPILVAVTPWCTLAWTLRGCLDPALPDHGQTTDNITHHASTWHQTMWSTWQQTTHATVSPPLFSL